MLRFRLPVYMAEKPSSTMSAADTIVTGGAASGSTSACMPSRFTNSDSNQ